MTRAAARNAIHSPPDAFAVLVATAREKLKVDFGPVGFDFDEPCWDIRIEGSQCEQRVTATAFHAAIGTTGDPLPPHFALPVKSWFILEYGSAATMGLRLDSARMLWEAILNRRHGAANRFRWEDLCAEDLSQAELLMRSPLERIDHIQAGNQHYCSRRVLGFEEELYCEDYWDRNQDSLTSDTREGDARKTTAKGNSTVDPFWKPEEVSNSDEDAPF